MAVFVALIYLYVDTEYCQLKHVIMKRRHFLRNSSLAAAGLASLSAAACSSSGSGNTSSGGQHAGDFLLKGMSIDDLSEKMISGELTSEQITKHYLARIADIDKDGPSINAIIELNPEAIDIARTMDEERKSGKVRGPMHGIPVIIKDNIDSGDQMMTTAGSLALKGHKAKEDAFIIKKLRASGAVLLGKANLSEWANFRSTRSSSGWSSRGGQTRNPYVLNRNTSGSSSGSAAAVAADLCTVAIGTETDGSVVSPSSICGVTGIKPTVGLLSRTGIIPISATQDTAGPMGKTVRDAAILLGALTGIDEDDPVTRRSEGKAYRDYAQFTDPKGLSGKRVGIEKSYLEGSEQMVTLYKSAINLMQKLGAETVEVGLLDKLKDLGDAEFTVLLYEFKDGLNRYFTREGTKTGSLADLIAFNKQHSEQAMPFFTQDILVMSEKKGDLKSDEYLDALRKSVSSRKIIRDLMAGNQLDAISSPTSGPAWCTDHVNGDYYNGVSFSTPAAISGFPHITVPFGLVFGLPVGFSFMSLPWTEAELIAMAYAFEQATPPRPVPEFLDTVEI